MTESEYNKPRVLLILGMHRSGTSATARVANLLGATLGTNLIEPAEDNPDGFWEHADVVSINEELLASLGRTWYDMREMPANWMQSEASAHTRGRITELMATEFAGASFIAIKDPRMCLTSALWVEVLNGLGYDVNCLFVVREPREVVNSLHVRNKWAKEPLFLMWVQYVIEATVGTRGSPRTLITFDQLLDNWSATMQRVAEKLAITWAGGEAVEKDVSAFLKKGNRHHVAASSLQPLNADDAIPLFAVDVYNLCLGIASSEKDWCDLEPLERRYKSVSGLYAARMDELLTMRWDAENRTQRAEAKLDSIVHVGEASLSAARDEIVQKVEGTIAQVDGRIGVLDERLEALGKRVAKFDKLFRKQMPELSRSILADEGRIASIEQTLDRQIIDLKQAVEQKELQVQQLLASSSWKVTAPFRWAVVHFSPSSIRRASARSLRWIYRHLPLPQAFKKAIKGAGFKLFAPLIKNTHSYRAWREGDAGTYAGAWSPSQSDALSGSGASHVLQDLYRTATGTGDDYVSFDDTPVDHHELDVRAIAFYLPQFHPIPENDEWWGKGFTEWTNVSKAVPQFVGHYQPRIPGELGFYDLRIVDVMRRQVELARHYGVQGFCFHYYWFAGKRLLERPLQQWLDNKDIDFPFCICWANENWTRRWDGFDQEMLISQDYSPEDDVAFITALEPLLRDPRYIRVGGRPLIVLYRPSILPDAAATLERWRAHCRKVGIGELFIAMVQFDVDDPRLYGFDAAIEFPPHKLARDLQPINSRLQIVNPSYSGHVIDYQSVVQRARRADDVDYPMFRGVFPSWDNEARKPGRGYTFANATPRRYREWLNIAVDYARRRPVNGERMVFINAWNEWAEGAYLEPDRRYGYAYLKQTRAALLASVDATDSPQRVVVVSHDANPHGAQYLALHLVRELSQGMGLEVEVVMLGGGRLESDFEQLAPVHKFYEHEKDAEALAQDLSQRGFEFVIANTAVAGRIVEPLQSAGMKVVSLVHELPGVIRSYGLEDAVRVMGEHAEHIVVPAAVVGEGLKEYFASPDAEAKLVVRPQGLFTRSRYRGLTRFDDARRNLRKRLSLPLDAKIVLSVGYADRRKGIDLLARAAIKCIAFDPNMHFVWVGHHEAEAVAEAKASLRDAGCEAHFHLVGMDFDTDDYYAGADVYALTSREDPFPSVVLESLSVRTPVVAFASTGGAADFIRENGCGVTVPAFDVNAYADALLKVSHDNALREELGEVGVRFVDLQFSFRAYAMDLLTLGGMNIPRVSVVVPNYNYARYMRERLTSVSEQSLPVYEIIVLDDASTDESLETLQKLRGNIHPEPLIVSNRQNSGSVFRQWLKGVEMARGDYVWIAEADDLSKPEFLARLTRLLDANPEAVIGFTQSEQIDEAGRLINSDYFGYTDDLCTARWSENYVADGRAEVIAGLAVKNTLPNVSGVLFRREPLLDVLRTHIEDIASYRIAGDWLVYLLLLRNGKIVFESSACNQHRRHRSSVTLGSRGQELCEEVLRIQRTAETMFELDDSTIEAARRYAESLKSHFGLSDTGTATGKP